MATSTQAPNYPTPINPLEIDLAVEHMRTSLSTLPWITHAYGRAFSNLKEKEKMHYPEVYIGKDSNNLYSYHRATPDNDKKGMVFFVIGDETADFETDDYNYIEWNVGIVFSINLSLIDDARLATQNFTQDLIREARQKLTNKYLGNGYIIVGMTATRTFSKIYKEYSLNAVKNYMIAPLDAFRIDLRVQIQEEC